ncbi:MAG: sulfatase-like hydrolase/transferase [Chloroflexota bacterium]
MTAQQPSTDRPNLLFIIADQLRADFLGCYGADFVETPNIDSLATQGVRYDRAYSAYPICVPARASLLTGMNAIRNGVTDNGLWLRPDLADCGIHTWPELLNQAGYHTGAIGKMHFYPWDITHGFQYRVAAEDKRWLEVRDEYYHFLRAHGYRKYHGNEHEGYYENKGAIINKIPWDYSVDHFVGMEACRYLETYGSEEPFAAMISFPGPHCPYDPNPEFLEGLNAQAMPSAIPEVPGNTPKLRQSNIDGNKGEWNGVDHTDFTDAHKQKIRLHYAALVRQIDYEIGQILRSLEESSLRNNTVIIFTSDHGDYLGDHNFIGKSTFFETGIHIPMIVSVPDGPHGAVCSELVMLTDITATLLTLAKVELPAYMDSQPLPGLGLPDALPRDRIYGMTSNGWMNFDGTWRLHKYSTGESLLFNVQDDPSEQRNLIRDPKYQEILVRLESELTQEIMRSVTDSHESSRVYSGNSMWSDPSFGARGWQRQYPLSRTIS